MPLAMCIMSMAWRAHPRWHLILIGNRDELHARPAAPLGRWHGFPHVIAGMDLQSGGTWLGVSDKGRCAIVTNRRGFGAPEADRVSRGQLVADMLVGIGDHSDPRTTDLNAFNPFNLVFIDRSEAQYLTNRPLVERATLAPGLYGLSNGALDEPWPKTLQLKAGVLSWLTGSAEHPEDLFDLLGSDRLPQVGLSPHQPSDAPDEATASPIFIRDPVYGTRCGTVVAVGNDGAGVIIERRFDSDGCPAGESVLRFHWAL